MKKQEKTRKLTYEVLQLLYNRNLRRKTNKKIRKSLTRFRM